MRNIFRRKELIVIIFIVGPTSTGKSEVAFKLAQRLGAEIVSCDSMLVYKEPNIITAKPPPFMLETIRHHFVSIISVEEVYNVFTYFSSATKVIKELFLQKIPVIVCGGSGLYAKAILDGIFTFPGRNEELRERLRKEAEEKGKEALYRKLKAVDPITAEKVSCNDLKRIIRALEVYYLTGVPLSGKKKTSKGLWGSLPIKIVGLTLSREALYDKINKRVEMMFQKGVVEEVKKLLNLKLSVTAREIIGIKEIARILKGEVSLEEGMEMVKKRTRNFAKRQFTWFRQDKRIMWEDVSGRSIENVVERIVNVCMRQ